MNKGEQKQSEERQEKKISREIRHSEREKTGVVLREDNNGVVPCQSPLLLLLSAWPVMKSKFMHILWYSIL